MYGKYSSYSSLMEAYREGRAVFHINHFRIWDNVRHSSNKIVAYMSYLMRVLIPLAVVICLNSFAYQSKLWWLSGLIIVIYSYIFDPGKLSVLLGLLMLTAGFTIPQNMLIQLGFGTLFAFVTAKISWKILEDQMVEQISNDKTAFEDAWNKELFLIQIDDEIYSSKRKAKVIKKGTVL